MGFCLPALLCGRISAGCLFRLGLGSDHRSFVPGAYHKMCSQHFLKTTPCQKNFSVDVIIVEAKGYRLDPKY